jgi:hypothetical protein
MFVPVSRAAVHKRLREGRLTGFTFYVTSQGKSVWGKPRKLKQRPYVVLSVSECKAWAAELKRRIEGGQESASSRGDEEQRLGYAGAAENRSSEREAREAEEFVGKDPKDRGDRGVVYNEPMTREEMMDVIQAEVRIAVERAFERLLPGKLGQKHRRRARGGGLVKNEKTKKWKWGTEASNGSREYR